MKWKNRLTNYNFWISLISAVLLILQAFDISFDIAYINEIATASLGLLVVIGIVSDPTKTVSSQVQIKAEKNAQEEKKEPETLEVEKVEDETSPFPVETEIKIADNDDKIDFQSIISEIKSALSIMQKQESKTETLAELKEKPIEEIKEEIQEVVHEEQPQETTELQSQFDIVN